MAKIMFTDDVGTTTVQSRWPEPVGRFQSWVPFSRGVGERAEALGTGAVTSWDYRVDHGFSCELRAISAHKFAGVDYLSRAARLVRHLLGGGTCSVYPLTTTVTPLVCRVAPGTEPSLTLADPRTLDYTLALVLVNTAGTLPAYPYARSL